MFQTWIVLSNKTGEEQGLSVPFPSRPRQFLPSNLSFLPLPRAYLMSSTSHNKGNQTRTLCRDAFPVNNPCLFRMRKVCPEIRDHRSSDPNNGHSVRLPVPLSQSTLKTAFFHLKIHLSSSQSVSKLHDVTGPLYLTVAPWRGFSDPTLCLASLLVRFTES